MRAIDTEFRQKPKEVVMYQPILRNQCNGEFSISKHFFIDDVAVWDYYGDTSMEFVKFAPWTAVKLEL